ncbi:DUF4279 domain-containing protein [Thiorhodococcus minor]|uniref:DUF4279 domain-containing protein n=1 Tax=Thiorhodococcus minor TaxID=57489 RepID=A0A6M0K755_9GAMM|nr:DUF4279 domain-containing protein [Thiorhodococcus minor]NEV65329.1 DUF4279 domain-containing protein [Thiorhodococcus minor]
MPDDISVALGIEPTRTILKKKKTRIKKNAWFLSTQDFVDSRDLRRHLFFVAERINKKIDALSLLKNCGWNAMLHCYWESREGNGGPILDVTTLKVIAKMEIDLHFDVWIDMPS